MNRFLFPSLALLFIPAVASAQAPDYHADGSVTVEGINYASMSEYHRSPAFRDNGRRCGSAQPPMISEFAPSDCSFSRTSIEGDYDPAEGEAYVIKTVFHVIERTDGVTGVISDELIQSQLDILNEDFGALAGTPGEPGTPSKISFEFAQFDPEGNPTNGINRVVSNNFYSNPEAAKQALAWDPMQYFNIYTNDANGALGYATFPTQSAGQRNDGIVLLWSSVGRNAPQGGDFNQGRTATHEVGHYFGLFHTFQGGCGDGYTAGDLIADTVPESSPHFGCTESVSSCAGVNDNNPIHNYMDYSDDTCMDHFTPEQVNRMRCSIVHYRTSLFNALPSVDFTFEPNEQTVVFTDLSADSDGTLERWEWDFGDGNTSTEQNPTHTYTEWGDFEVQLTVLDDRGSRASKTVSFRLNIAPIAAFDYDASDIRVDFIDQSSDPNGEIRRWAWDFGDGQTSRAQSPSHAYAVEGSYMVSLSVTDDLGETTTVTTEVTVGEGGGCGCSSSSGGGPLGTIVLIGLALVAVRRRR